MILNVVQKTVEPDITVLVLEGRLSLGRECQHVEDMVRQLKESGHKKLIFDLTQLNYSDSAGLGMMAMAAAMMRGAGGDLRLAAPVSRVVDALKLTQLDKILPIYPDLAAACQGF